MNKSILNLGPFNDCVDMLEDGRTARYGPSDGGEIFYCSEGVLSGSDVNIASIINEITVPMSILGLAYDCDTPENRQKLIRAVELKILSTIYFAASKYNVELKLSKVVIPIKSINFKVDNHKRLCITAILGVAMFENSMVRLSA